MKLKNISALIAGGLGLSAISSVADAHLVQFGWKDNGAGGIVLYGEHWHGNLGSAYSDNAGIKITPVSFVGPTIVAQWSGVVNDTPAASLNLTGAQCDPGNPGCNAYGDWMFTVPIALGNGVYDFITGPGCCVDTMTDSVRITVTGVTSVPPGTIGNGVPEPGTWAMLILGMGVAGAAMRRRKQTTQVSFA